MAANPVTTDRSQREPRRPIWGPVVQVAYVVDDPERSAHLWCQRHGAGPFFFREHIAVSDVVYRGEPSTFDHSSAFGWCGEMMIELLVQHDRAPSAVTERFAPGESGLHHLACFVPDLDAALGSVESIGMSVAATARAGALRFAFVDDRAASGHHWELYEPTPHLLGFYAAVRNAAEMWDGAEPFRHGSP